MDISRSQTICRLIYSIKHKTLVFDTVNMRMQSGGHLCHGGGANPVQHFNRRLLSYLGAAVVFRAGSIFFLLKFRWVSSILQPLWVGFWEKYPSAGYVTSWIILELVRLEGLISTKIYRSAPKIYRIYPFKRRRRRWFTISFYQTECMKT